MLATTNRFNFQIMISLLGTTGVVLARLARVLERRNKCSEMPLVGKRDIIDLRIAFRHFLRTANVKRSRELAIRFTFVRLGHALELLDNFRTIFCTLKHHNPTFERKYYFLEYSRLLIIEFFFEKKVILKTICLRK